MDEALGRPASPAEKAFPTPASDRLLDDACTLLAALRTGIQPPETGIPVSVVSAFLEAAKIILPSHSGEGPGVRWGEVQPDPAKSFLDAPRPKALEMLGGAWQDSEAFNELRMVPGLSCEGEWKNQPLETREFLINLLEAVPEKQWWSLPAFVRDVKAKYPDFQRPAGDYDSWFIRDTTSGLYLRGAEHWDEVEGALIRFFICGPLHWLGMMDLASPETGAPAASFRFSAWAADLLKDKPPAGLHKEDAPLQVNSDGRLRLPALTPRAVRYQIARFCQWEPETQGEYRYRITPAALERARSQGLRTSHLVGLLRRHAATPPAPSLVQALERWDEQGTQATFEKVTILRVATPEIMNTLRRSPAGRFLGDPLGATSIIIKENAAEKVLAALAQMGYLADARID